MRLILTFLFCFVLTIAFSQPHSKPPGDCSDIYAPVHTKKGKNYLNECIARYFTDAKLFEGNYSDIKPKKEGLEYLPITQHCAPHYPPTTPVMIKNKDGKLVADGTLQFGYSNLNSRGVWQKPCYKKCLPPETAIYTPYGLAKVSDLKIGDIIYTTNKEGQRIEAPIINKDSVKVAFNHLLINILLEDGRRIKCTPEHPNADYSLLSSLKTGNLLDGSKVIEIHFEHYTQPYTFDILPAGETGVYWASGIRLGSTLFPEQLSIND